MPLRLRLVTARGAWRFDEASIVRLGDRVEPQRLHPQRVLRGDAEDAAALATIRDPRRALISMPGDTWTFEYALPEDQADSELFLESRGYYLEWMRQEWLAEENPSLALRLFTDPRRAMREMAPAFKCTEAQLDSLFWGSRYESR